MPPPPNYRSSHATDYAYSLTSIPEINLYNITALMASAAITLVISSEI